MFSRSDRLAFFSFISPAHSFFGQFEAYRKLVADSPEFALLQLAGAGAFEVHADIKAERNGDGLRRLDRFYWSLQLAAGLHGANFRSVMLLHRAGRGDPTLHTFPDDPYLPTMAAYFGGVVEDGGLRLLRYVPLRRVTFLLGAHGAGTERVGKLKRASKIVESRDKLAIAHAAAQKAGASFRVAQALELDRNHCVFYQERLPGRSLLSCMTPENWIDLLERVGEVNAELNGLDARGLPAWRPSGYLSVIDEDVAWISHFQPEHGRRLDPAVASARSVIEEGNAPCDMFCHADFVPSQILVDEDGNWAITDFDSARQGDPHQEIAKFCAGLKYELPFFAQSDDAAAEVDLAAVAPGEEAYLRGYLRCARLDIDARRLAAFRVCAEIHHLGLMLKKDGYYAPTFRAVVAAIEDLSARL